ncbi:hypothetical protein ACTXT7_015478 [Hymenolepis weldensis]
MDFSIKFSAPESFNKDIFDSLDRKMRDFDVLADPGATSVFDHYSIDHSELVQLVIPSTKLH